MQEWSYDIEIKISGCGIEAKTKKEAIEEIKDGYYKETGIHLDDCEISNVEKFDGGAK